VGVPKPAQAYAEQIYSALDNENAEDGSKGADTHSPEGHGSTETLIMGRSKRGWLGRRSNKEKGEKV